jgi:hypothetical protein
MIKVVLRGADGQPVDHLVEPLRLAIFDDQFCRTLQDYTPNRKLFNKCIEFADHYNNLDAKTKKVYDDIVSVCGGKFKGQQQIQTWWTNFLSDLVDTDDIINFITLAENSGNSTLHAIACGKIMFDITSLSLDEIRAKYKFTNDFSQTEATLVQEENRLWSQLHPDASGESTHDNDATHENTDD